jgi:hypothetical protein
MNFELSLIDSVRRGELDFERLVEVLSSEGYLTDADGSEGLGFVSARIEAARQEHFDALWKFFYPGKRHDIRLRSCATNKGFTLRGDFNYALFNENQISYEDVMHALQHICERQGREALLIP